MKKLMISAVTGLVCGLALLAAPAAHAQGEIETLWEPTQPAIERVDAGTPADASAAVGGLFNNMLCYTDSQNHYGIGQRQGQLMKKVVVIPPTQVKNHGPNQIYLWGQVKQGPMQGTQVAAIFKQVKPDQIDARLRIVKPGQKPVDVTVHYQMKLIWKNPGFDNWGETPTTPSTGGPKQTPGDPKQTPRDPKPVCPVCKGSDLAAHPATGSTPGGDAAGEHDHSNGGVPLP